MGVGIIPVDNSYVITLQANSRTAGLVVRAIVYIELADGSIQDIPVELTTSGEATLDSKNQQLVPGRIVDVSIIAVTFGVRMGDIYAMLILSRNSIIQGLKAYTLCKGYVTGRSGVSLLSSTSASEGTGIGLPVRLTVANPAAGAEFNLSCAQSRCFRLQALQYRFVTDANVTNRIPTLVYNEQTVDTQRSIASAVQAAITTIDYYWGIGYSPFVNSPLAQQCLPDYLAAPTFVVSSLTRSIQAGDQYSSIIGQGIEWFAGS